MVKNMKEDMMVVSINAVTDNLMEIEYVPLLQPKTKMKLTDLATGGVSKVINEVQNQKQRRNKIYLSRQFCSDNFIVPFSAIQVEVSIPDQEEMKAKYV